jgi:AcrR family transcriptional regulator
MVKGILDDSSAKQRLIRAATELFAKKGLEGTSTRDIAKATGLNISLISYYFGGKEGLYKAVLWDFAQTADNNLTQLMGLFATKEFNRETFDQQIRLIITAMIRIKFDNPYIHILFQRETLSGLPHAKDLFENVFGRLSESIVGLFKKAQSLGIMKPDIQPYVLFFSMVHATDDFLVLTRCKGDAASGLHLLKNLPQMPDELDQYIEQIYKIFIQGALR